MKAKLLSILLQKLDGATQQGLLQKLPVTSYSFTTQKVYEYLGVTKEEARRRASHVIGAKNKNLRKECRCLLG